MGNCYNGGIPYYGVSWGIPYNTGKWGSLVGKLVIPPIPTMKNIPTMWMTPFLITLFTMGSDGYFSSFSTIGAGKVTRIGLSFYSIQSMWTSFCVGGSPRPEWAWVFWEAVGVFRHQSFWEGLEL